jgi:PAS domain S-box-containing protein
MVAAVNGPQYTGAHMTISNARSDRRREALLHAGALAAFLAIFAIDLREPLVYSTGILYVLVILLGLWSGWQAYPIVAAALATMLLVADVIAGWEDPPSPAVFVNRPLMALVFVATAALVMHFKRLEQKWFSGLAQLTDIKRALDHAAIVATTDVTGLITYVNDKFCEISKYRREELLGQDHRLINSGYHPKEYIRDLWRTIANGRVWHGELRNRAKDGTYYWVDTTIVPFLDARGKPYQYIAIRADITARKTAEERLAQQAALARLGQMAAVVAHEVRNPLAGIKGAVQVLMSRPREEMELTVMREVVARIDALAELIDDIMLFARPRPAQPRPVNVRNLLLEAAAAIRADPANASLEVTVNGRDITLRADPELLKPTLLNLLINAAQATRGRGRVAVTVAEDGPACVVDIVDTGPGIPADVQDRVFEPFFTTKARGGGLGLPIARRTVELHGGTLTLVPHDGGGAWFRITLPLQASSPPAVAASAALDGTP